MWVLDQRGPDINVIPINDIVDHQPDSDCWCDPVVEFYYDVTGTVFPDGKTVIIHNSADQRERGE